MRRIENFLIAVLSGSILSLGWYEWGSGLFLLFGFVPLLWLEEKLGTAQSADRKGGRIFLYASLSFFVWNIAATWWIKNASMAGLAAAVLVSTLFMSIPVWLYSITKKSWGKTAGYLAFILYWLTCEFFYMHGEISWPWLTLGDGFLFDIKFIQWYEFTGVFGGSAWILFVNVLIYETIKGIRTFSGNKNRMIILTSATIICILLPIFISLYMYTTYKEKSDPREIVIVQPNIDPYMKFNDIPSMEQTSIHLTLAEKYTRLSTDYVVCPETSINNNVWIDQMNYVPDIRMIKSFVNYYPKLKFVIGVTCYQQYTESNKTGTSKPLSISGLYYDSYNSAIQIDTTDTIQLYHKSKLVVGVEKMPYPQYLKILKPLTLRLGGTFRSHGTQKERDVFLSADSSVKAAPVICYESVYGEYVGDYIRKKEANIIFVITNDGWWGNTPGHRQHNALSAIRAVETRRSIARSANTGISCFINQRGDVLQKLTWWKRGSLHGSLNINNKITFYSRHGDYIGRISVWLSVIMLLSVLIKGIAGLFHK